MHLNYGPGKNQRFWLKTSGDGRVHLREVAIFAVGATDTGRKHGRLVMMDMWVMEDGQQGDVPGERVAGVARVTAAGAYAPLRRRCISDSDCKPVGYDGKTCIRRVHPGRREGEWKCANVHVRVSAWRLRALCMRDETTEWD